MKTRSAVYSEVRNQIRDGDLLLYVAKQKLSNRLIARGTDGKHAHAAMAAWWGDVLMCVEMTQAGGVGRAVTLSSQVRGWPGQYEVFRTNPHNLDFDVQVAVEIMVRLAGTPYGWWNLLRLFIRRMLIVRLLVKPVDDDTANGRPPHCSGAISRACRAAGQDPVPNKPDWATTPVDLGESRFFDYQYTLIWEKT